MGGSSPWIRPSVPPLRERGGRREAALAFWAGWDRYRLGHRPVALHPKVWRRLDVQSGHGKRLWSASRALLGAVVLKRGCGEPSGALWLVWCSHTGPDRREERWPPRGAPEIIKLGSPKATSDRVSLVVGELRVTIPAQWRCPRSHRIFRLECLRWIRQWRLYLKADNRHLHQYIRQTGHGKYHHRC